MKRMMIKNESFLWYFLRWLTSFGDIIDGICGLVTFGFWTPLLGYRMSVWLLHVQKTEE